MRHKKIPSKNRKKLKQVDPFNKKGAAVRAAELKKRNWEPSTDEQPIARSLLDLQENVKLVDKKEIKKKKMHKNKILEEASRAGIEKGRFEGMQQFIRRVERQTYRAIDDHKVIVAQGMAGRDQMEIDADYKVLEDKEERQKTQKKREIENKIKAAREAKDKRTKQLQERLEAKLARQEARRKELEKERNGGEDAEEDDQEEAMEDLKEEREFKKSAKGQKRAEKEKERKRLEAKHKKDEALLYSKEVIRFGERNDEPPKFEGLMKKGMDQHMAKAGGKQLLLHAIMKKETGIKTQYMEDAAKKQTPDAEERLRVIEAYRDLKRRKNAGL